MFAFLSRSRDSGTASRSRSCLEQHSLGLVVARERHERGAEQALRGADGPVVLEERAPAARHDAGRTRSDPQAFAQQRLRVCRAVLPRQLHGAEIDRVNRDQLMVGSRARRARCPAPPAARRRLVVPALCDADTRDRLLSVVATIGCRSPSDLALNGQHLPELRFGGGIVAPARGDQREIVQRRRTCSDDARRASSDSSRGTAGAALRRLRDRRSAAAPTRDRSG